MTTDLIARARRLKLMAFDVDGVLTDGRIYYTDEGTEFKAFNTLDGHGMKMLAGAGVQLAIITGRRSRCVEVRARNLGIDLLYQGVHDKLATLGELAAQLGVGLDEAGYIGDDVVDLPVMQACGFSAAPANAHPLVRSRSRWLATQRGGEGAVREMCDFLLEARGDLERALAPWLGQAAG